MSALKLRKQGQPHSERWVNILKLIPYKLYGMIYMIQDFKCMLMVDIQLRKFIVVIVYSRN